MILDFHCRESIILERALEYWLDGYSEDAPGRPDTTLLLQRVRAIKEAAGAPTCETCESCLNSGWVTK